VGTSKAKTPAAPFVREVRCKSILSESGICDYSLNCYTGCVHGCSYCYARFMGRFHHPDQPWGQFVDVKVNGPEVLARQLGSRKLFSPGSVFVSSVCDPYQPVESEYRLTRRCVKLLLEAGFRVHIQTKSDLVRRDFDILAGQPNVSVCETITTLDEELSARIEPLASPPSARLETLRQAAEAGIAVKAFVGPLLPDLTDTDESIRRVFAALAELPVDEVYVDRLNLRWGVWPALKQVLTPLAPAALGRSREVLFDTHRGRAYDRTLRTVVRKAASQAGIESVLNLVV
jgi:DNA repair photolyase